MHGSPMQRLDEKILDISAMVESLRLGHLARYHDAVARYADTHGIDTRQLIENADCFPADFCADSEREHVIVEALAATMQGNTHVAFACYRLMLVARAVRGYSMALFLEHAMPVEESEHVVALFKDDLLGDVGSELRDFLAYVAGCDEAAAGRAVMKLRGLLNANFQRVEAESKNDLRAKSSKSKRMAARVAARDDLVALAERELAAFPSGDDAFGALDDGHERQNVVRLETSIHHHISHPTRH